jgi:hypothetical protein
MNETLRITPNLTIPYPQLAHLCQAWQIERLALFGSALRPDFNAASDIDLLYQFEPQAHPTVETLLALEAALADLFGRPVDLVSQKAVQNSPNYLRRQHILESAQVIYANGEGKTTSTHRTR